MKGYIALGNMVIAVFFRTAACASNSLILGKQFQAETGLATCAAGGRG